jgi:mono/diheme cytochrome c family protein
MGEVGMRAKLVTVCIIAVVAITGVLGWFGYLTFTTGFSAKAEPHALEVWLARQARYLAIPLADRHKPNPVPASPEVVQEGLAHFADHCAVCHANDGSGRTPIGKNVYPKAPDLREPATQTMSDGELFWVIHNGIRFTAMPAWGEGDPEQDLDSWKLVHFIRHLPQLTPEELDRMKTLNPTTKHQRDEEASFDRFLQGDDTAGAPAGSDHHH